MATSKCAAVDQPRPIHSPSRSGCARSVKMASPARVRENLTLEEFLRLPEEEPPLEYIDGRVEADVSPQKKHGRIELKLSESLDRFAEPGGLGLAIPELRCTFAGRSIVPDVVFLLDDHIAVDDRGVVVNEGFL